MAKFPGCNLEFVREDDYVEYFIFPKLPDNLTKTYANDADKLEEVLRNHLNAVLKQCNAIVEQRINDFNYIWHKDEFQLQLRTESAQDRLLNDETKHDGDAVPLPPHLHGVTHVGENIEDEWFIMDLLNKLSLEIPGCIARIIDSDGEFLLIEAAEILPKWANPETCEQRVYIAEGSLQLVQNSPSNTAKLMPVAAAIEKIRQNPTLYRVSREIQDCINRRLEEFHAPKNAALHHQVVRLPLGVASLLKTRPALIAAAVRAFCERDAVDMKACRTMRFFPPEQRVRTNVCFTRCLYAMIMHSNYVPDRKIGWNLSGATKSEQYKEDLLGIKIACGFEILASLAKDMKNEENEPAWRTYVRSLTAKGYFRENIEGSEEYNRLLVEAKSYFKRNNERFRTAPLVGSDILDLIQKIEVNAEELCNQENNLQPSDADDWLNITAEQLDVMLMERYGPKKLFKSDGGINAEEFTNNIADFLEKQSTFNGIDSEASDNMDDEDGHNDDEKDVFTASAAISPSKRDDEFKAKVKKNHSMRKACKGNSIIGDATNDLKKQNLSKTDISADSSYTTHVRNFLDFVIPEDNWDSNSEMSDYEDEVDLERNFESMANSEMMNIDMDIKAYMAQMDKELAKTTIGQSFDVPRESSNVTGSTKKSKGSSTSVEDDFDDIESFQPININVNTLKNMMDSYKSQIGGAGPVSNLLHAMGVGMSAVAAVNDETKDIKESSV